MSTTNVGCRFALYNAGARTYHTGIGRWLQEDPIVGITSDPMSFNRYLYCDANPVLNDDPTGLVTTKPGRKPCNPDKDMPKHLPFWVNLGVIVGGILSGNGPVAIAGAVASGLDTEPGYKEKEDHVYGSIWCFFVNDFAWLGQNAVDNVNNGNPYGTGRSFTP